MHFGNLLLGALLLATAASPALAAETVEGLQVQLSEVWGRFLTDGNGRALYVFAEDVRGKGPTAAQSNCTGACATAWPPAVLQADSLKAGERVRADLVGTIQRKDGDRQLTYSGWPLYYWVGDRGPGEATGQDVKASGGEWYLIAASGAVIERKQAGVAGRPGPAKAESIFAGLDFKGPECVRHDRERDRYLVSNINGKMMGVDDNGFISLLKPDGSMTDLKWIDGTDPKVTLNSPKGIEISGGELHVADINFLRTFDAQTGKPLRSVRIEGAKFLNDLAVAEDGTVYITDTGTKDVPGAIYKVTPDQKVTAIAKGRDLHRPNGIDFDQNGNLVAVTYGGDEVIVLSTDGEVKERRTLKAGKLDGLVVRSDGTRLVSSWKGKHVVRLDADGNARTILSDVRTPAAFGVDEQRSRLLVPAVKENKIAVAPLL